MTNTELIEKVIIPIVSAFLGAIIGAILAFNYQFKIELKREKRQLLQVLMAYRNVGAFENDWIKALNMIDIVYHDEKKVIELLHKYFAYTKPPLFETGQHLDVLYSLIFEMGLCTGYKNLSLSYIRDIYAPDALERHYPSNTSK